MRDKSAFQPNGLKQIQLADTSLFNDANLISYYKLEDVSDSKGAYTLTNNGSVAFNSGKFNNGADFGTANSSKYLSVTHIDPDSYNSGLSIAFWIKFNTTPTSSNEAFVFEDGGWGGVFARFQSSTGVDFRFGNGVTSDGGTTSATGNFTAGVWNHIVMVHNATSNTYYINGVQVAQRTTGTITLSNNGTLLNIGRTTSGILYCNAIIDDFAIFSKALTAGEVSQLYYSGSTKAYYPLNGNSTDYSGQGNNGTDTAITYPQGRFGQGARFNGSSSKIAIGTTSTLQLSPTVTVSAWFKTSSTSVQLIFSKDSQATGGYIGYGLYTSFSATGDVAMRVRTATGVSFSDLASGGYYTDNRWHNVVGVYNAGSQQIYVDGIRRNSGGSGTVIHWATPQIPNIGASSVSDNWFNGIVDELIIEDRAWTAKEVETYYRKSTLNYHQKTFGQMVYTYISELLKGQYTLTGKQLNPLYNRVVQLAKGAFALTGKQLSVAKAFTVQLGAGVFNLVGKALSVPMRWREAQRSSSTWTEETKNNSTWTEKNRS